MGLYFYALKMNKHTTYTEYQMIMEAVYIFQMIESLY